MKKFLICIGVLAAIVLATWAACEIAGRNSYDLEGFITGITQNEQGNTVITVLYGQTESVYVEKWYTRKSAPTKEALAVGDHIRLSTTLHSDTNIKKLKVSPGYSTEGKLVYIENLNNPFLLAASQETGTKYLVSLISHPIDTLAGMETGDTVRVYHEAPVTGTFASEVINGAVLVAEGSPESLTQEDIDYITSEGYTLKTE